MPTAIISQKAKSTKIIKLECNNSNINNFDAFNFTPSKGVNFDWQGISNKLGVDNTQLRKSGVRDLISTSEHSIDFSHYSKILNSNPDIENLNMKEFYNNNKDKFVGMFNNQIAFLGVKKEGVKFGTITLNLSKLETCKGEKIAEIKASLKK